MTHVLMGIRERKGTNKYVSKKNMIGTTGSNVVKGKAKCNASESGTHLRIDWVSIYCLLLHYPMGKTNSHQPQITSIPTR